MKTLRKAPANVWAGKAANALSEATSWCDTLTDACGWISVGNGGLHFFASQRLSLELRYNSNMQRNSMKKAWWALLVLTLLLGAVIALIDEGIRTPAAPLGIVSFELCAYAHSCTDILASWNAKARQLVALSLGIDYLFLFLYPAVIFVSLLLVAPLVPQRFETFTRGSAWAAWGMGLTDAIENYFLTQMLLTESAPGLAWPAAIFASIKFAILGHTLIWLIVAGVMCAVLSAQRRPLKSA